MASPMSVAELRERASRLPRLHFCNLPTPLQECPRFAAALGGGVRIFLKRDDLTPIGLGGNKLRKLEFILGAARAEGCDVIINALAGQSNYCRQTAAAAARIGMDCILVLRRDHKTGDPAQGNRLLDFVFGADVRMVANDRAAQAAARDDLAARLRAGGRKPWVVGRRDEVLGAVAYALCLAEIVEQMAALGEAADIVVVTGRAGTTAGLALGRRLLGFTGETQSFDVAPWPAGGPDPRAESAAIAADGARLLGREEPFAADDIRDTPVYAGPAYGTPTDAGLDALLLLGRTEGLLVGPVYSAKGLSGLVDGVRSGRIPRGSRVVFIHTGGIPETFAYNGEIMDRIAAAGKA